MSVELATAYVSIVPSTQGLGKAIEAEFNGPGAEKAGTSAGNRAGGGFASGFGKVVAGAGLLTGAAVAGVGVGLFKLGSTFDDAFDKIRVGTGKTGDALEGLKDDFRSVAKDTPSSFDDVSTAVSGLSQRLGVTGQPLQDLSREVLNLSRITGTDLSTNIAGVTRLFGDWGVKAENQTTTMDELFRASQASGIGVDELSQSLVQFGAPLRNVGFSLQQSEALLAVFNKTGVNTDTVMAGLKAGVGKLAKAGESVPDTFKRVVAEITKLGPGTESTKKAIELFGQRAGPDLADAISGGKFAFDDMLKAITGGKDTIDAASGDTADFAEKWQTLKNRVFLALEPIATRFFGLVGTAMDKLAPIFKEITGGISAFQGAWVAADGDVTSAGFPGLMEKLANLIHLHLIPALIGFGDRLRDLWKEHGPQVVAVLQAVFDGIRTGVEFIATHQSVLIGFGVFIGTLLVAAFLSWAASALAAAAATLVAIAPVVAIAVVIAALTAAVIWAYQNWGWFRTAVDAVAHFFADILWPILKAVGEFLITEFVPAVVKVAEWIGGRLVAAIKDGISFISSLWHAAVDAKDFLVAAFEAVVDFVTKLPGRLASAAAGIWDWITAPFRAAMETVRKLWNDTIGGFSFSIPDWIPIPGVGGKTFSVPKLHSGGMVPGAPGSDVPILAQAGELVLSRAQVAAVDAMDSNPGGIGRDAPLVGTMYVTDGRPVLEQLVEVRHLLPA